MKKPNLPPLPDATGMTKGQRKAYLALFASLYTHFRMVRGESAEVAVAHAGEEAVQGLIAGAKNHWIG